MTLISGEQLPLTRTYEKRIKKYFGLSTLRNVVPYSEVARILHQEGILEWEKDIRKWTKRELEREFSTSAGQVNVSRLVRNLLWQTYQQIIRGELPSLDGNIRSYWYSHLKSVLSRLGIAEGTDHYQTLIGMFTRLAVDYGLFRYREFGLQDEREFLKNIGHENVHVILFAEKSGFAFTLEQLHHELGITTICLAGQPSQLSTEYFVADLAREVDLKETTFQVFSLTDYDPAGWLIQNEFFERLERRGLKIKRHDLMQLKHFTKREIELFKYNLIFDGAWVVLLHRWMEATGGIDGEPFGLEKDAKPRREWQEIFRREARPYLNRARRRASMPCIQSLIHHIEATLEEYENLTREQMRKQLYADVDRFIDGVYWRG